MYGTSGVLVFSCVALLVLGLAAAAAPSGSSAGGRVIYVSPTGRAGAPGTAEAPLGRVQEALDRARAGDTVHLRPGVYRERVSFKHSGEYQRPVTLEGEPGAILDASEPVTLRWTRAEDIGPEVWRAPVSFFARTVFAEGRMVTALSEERVMPPQQTDPKWQWQYIFRNGIGPTRHDGATSGWDGVKALAMYRHEAKELLIRFKDGRDPNGTPITVSPEEPIVNITGVDRCVVRGLALRNGEEGVRIRKSLGSVVEQCTIGPGEYGVLLLEGADRATVRFNEIFMDPFSGASSKLPGSWDNWLAHKTGGFSDRDGVLMIATVGGHQIHDNYIHDHWDGIEDWVGMDEETKIYEAEGRDHNLNVHHNRIVNISDDGLEPNGEEVNCEWHDNIVEECMCGCRIKAPRVGPLYLYHNIFFDNGEDFRNFGGGEIMRPAPVYVYQNTSTAGPAISHMAATGVGTPQYHFENNLFWCRAPFWVSDDSLPPNWLADHNVYVRRSDDEHWGERKEQAIGREQDRHSQWVEEGLPGFVDFEKHDVRLTADSPARERGADLSALFDKPLPGCQPGYFQGVAPDAGALQYGEPMPRLPRRPEEVECPEAGTWPQP
jgi:hypothetical protein